MGGACGRCSGICVVGWGRAGFGRVVGWRRRRGRRPRRTGRRAPRMRVGGRRGVSAVALRLSYSRKSAVVWSQVKDMLSWLWVHGEAFVRLKGVTATVRVDNVKTAMARGAGVWGEVSRAYLRYAEEARFHIDPCPPRSPEAKGKIERGILDLRGWGPGPTSEWSSLEELQAWTDVRLREWSRGGRARRRGAGYWRVGRRSRGFLGDCTGLPEPFDLMGRRPVRKDCTVAFDGRSWSVPFRLVGGAGGGAPLRAPGAGAGSRGGGRGPSSRRPLFDCARLVPLRGGVDRPGDGAGAAGADGASAGGRSGRWLRRNGPWICMRRWRRERDGEYGCGSGPDAADPGGNSGCGRHRRGCPSC